MQETAKNGIRKSSWPEPIFTDAILCQERLRRFSMRSKCLIIVTKMAVGPHILGLYRRLLENRLPTFNPHLTGPNATEKRQSDAQVEKSFFFAKRPTT